MMTKEHTENSYELALREWAYYQSTGNTAMGSIKFGEIWAYGKVLELDPKMIMEDMARSRND